MAQHRTQQQEGPEREVRASFKQEEMLKLGLDKQQKLARERATQERGHQETAWWILEVQRPESL